MDLWIASITTAVAAIVCVFAVRQYYLARSNFRLALFEKRYVIYKAVQAFLTHIVQKADLEYDTLPGFYTAMQDARFLYGDDVNNYIREIKNRAFSHKMGKIRANDLLHQPNQKNERSLHITRSMDDLKWMAEQLDRLPDVFGRYLNMRRKF